MSQQKRENNMSAFQTGIEQLKEVKAGKSRLDQYLQVTLQHKHI